MRILHTESSTGWGGQENRTLNEMLAMRERGHDMAVLGRPGARILERAAEAGFPTFTVDQRGSLDVPAILKLRRVLREFAADVVNTHSGRDTQLVGMAARSLGRKRPRIVRTRHLALPITSRFSYSVLPDHVVTVSRFVAGYLTRAGVPPAMITTVTTGVDFSRYPQNSVGNLKAELGLPASAPLIGTVAILRAKKGHAEILDAVPAVLARFPDAHFVFAGDGPQADNLKARLAAEGLTERVHLLGLRRDVSNVLASLDIFLLPTHQEALGTAFIEAGAMGLPTIATHVDGVPEVVQDGITGLLVKPQADGRAAGSELAQAMISLLADPARRQAMGAAASDFVRRQFSRERMAEGMEALYLRLLEAQ